ncbi:hemerythrin domain-containing protein [Dactylosporangium sp. CA-139066]|uniref:hemerythrin domain-containing protein n=1 Tax=Dactylosporangium sp. CA-139066 TaxID=3239930 RepID=UPI003D8EF48B
MSQEFKNLDMTMMFTIHDALRRELERIARITARVDEDPRHVLSTAVGWEMFKKNLTIHHTSEDLTLWPVMQQALAGRPDDLALLDAMEAEHAVIDPLLADIDAALADRDSGLERLTGLTDALYTKLRHHLAHEESEALNLMDSTLTKEQWGAFGKEQSGRHVDDTSTYLPWLLDDMPAAKLAAFIGNMPEPLRSAYENEWRAAYEALDIWGAKTNTATH